MAPANPKNSATKGTRRAATVKTAESQGPRHAAILAVAARLFAEKGFASSTIRDIATEAGMLSGSLYYHFDSKESMAVEILDEAFAGFLVKYADLESTDDVRERIEMLFLIGFQFIVDHPDAASIIQNDYGQWKSDKRFESVNRKYGAVRQVWLDVMRRAQDEGLVRKDLDVKLAYATMMGGMFATGTWFDPEGPMSMTDVAHGQTDLFLNGMLVVGEAPEFVPTSTSPAAPTAEAEALSAENSSLRDEIRELKGLLADAIIGKIGITRA